jgi:hypothetical protein
MNLVFVPLSAENASCRIVFTLYGPLDQARCDRESAILSHRLQQLTPEKPRREKVFIRPKYLGYMEYDTY